MSGTIIVPRDVARRAEGLIAATIPANVLKGVELLLFENLYVEGASHMPNANQADCSSLLKRGTNLLQNSPFDLLGIEIRCGTADVRKAYKKLALKYHPDKNPKTTPLFQIIQTACSKLSDSEQRAKEAAYVAQRRAAAGVSAARPVDQSVRPGYPPHTGNNNNYNNHHYGSQKATPATASSSTASQNGYHQYSAQQQKPAYHQPQPQPQQQPPQQQPAQQQQQSARSKNYYEELLKEQYRKAAAAEQRAKEYANRRFAEQKGDNDWSSSNQSNNNNNKPQPSATPDMKPDTNPFNRGGSTNMNNAHMNSNNTNSSTTEQPKLNPFRPVAAASAAAPNPVQVNQSYDWQNIYNNQNNPKNANASNATKSQSQTQVDNNNNNGGGPRTFRASFDGQVHVQQTISTNKQSAAEPKVTPRKIVPKPFDLKFVSIAATVVELEWKTSALYSTHLAVELSWREKYPHTNRWESSDKLIRSGCCRKKNLKARTCYEFRVRAVEDTGSSGIQGGLTSEWTEILTVTLPAPSPAVDEEAPAAAATAAAKPPPIVQQQSSSSSSTSARHHVNAGAKLGALSNNDSNNYRKFNVLSDDDQSPSTANKTNSNTTATKRKSLSPVPPAVEPSPAVKGLAKYLSKDKILSSSAREAWGDNSKPSTTTSKSRKPSVQTDDTDDHEATFFEIEEDLDDLFSAKIRKSDSNTTAAQAKSKATPAITTPTNNKAKVTEEKYSDEEFEISDDEEVFKVQHNINRSIDDVDADIIEEEEEVYTDDSDYSSTISRQNKKKTGGSTSLDTSLEHEEEMLEYQLIPPPSGWNRKDSTKRASAKETRSNDGSNYRHPVHSEPFPKSSIKGYLQCDRIVIVGATCGDWLRVKIHIPIISDSKKSAKSSSVKYSKVVWGWCLQLEQGHEFLQPNSKTNKKSSPAVENVDRKVQGLSIDPASALKKNAGVNNHMSPPKESHGTVYFGSSAILNQSFFNMPRPTPTKEKTTPSSSSKSSLSTAAATDSNKVQNKRKKKSSVIAEGDESSEMMKEAVKKATNSVLNKSPVEAEEEDVIEEWIECFDEHGHCYYYNEAKNESQWELPLWVEETDPVSGAKYYSHAAGYGDNVVFTSTWEKPKKFARLIRSTAV